MMLNVKPRVNKLPSIILIVIDCLRARNLGCYGYKYKTSPNIDEISRYGVIFNRHFSCTNATIPSMLSMLTGLHPEFLGISQLLEATHLKTFKILNPVTLPQILKHFGYITIGLDWILSPFKSELGFEHYGFPMGTRIKHYIRSLILTPFKSNLMRKIFKINILINNATKVTDMAIDILRKFARKSRPLFLLIHYWDTHMIYYSPRKFRSNRHRYERGDLVSLFKGDNYVPQYLVKVLEHSRFKSIEELLAAYDAAITYVDHELGRLFEFMYRANILDDVITIITADHGESLLEHGIYFTHHGLYDVTLHVPFILIYPAMLPVNKRINNLTCHIDIMPTILDLIKFNTWRLEMHGKSLLPLILQGRKVHDALFFSEREYQRSIAIRTLRFKYIMTLGDPYCKACKRVHGSPKELYDLKKDPEEVNNIINKYPDVAAVLEQRLLTWLKDMTRLRFEKIIKWKIRVLKQTMHKPTTR